jgi:ParB-like nuclease domain
MIKCFFVDVKSIKSDLPKSNFVESELEQLADLILEADGLLRPLILQEIKAGKYQVIEGHREYYAAVRAKEKNIAKAEMVNAFVIGASSQKSAIAQLSLLSGSPLTGATNVTDSSPQLDRLLPKIESTISEQLQPILEQLAKHTAILDRLTLERSIQPTTPKIIEPIIDRVEPQLPVTPIAMRLTETTTKIEPIIDRVESQPIATPIPRDRELPKSPKPKADKTTKSTTKKTTKAVDPESSINASNKALSTGLKQSTAATVSKSTNKTKPPSTKATNSISKTKPPSAVLASIDPVKATTVLKLVNTLDLQQLMVSMERSGLSKTTVKLVPNIIEYRNSLSDGQIDSWETIIDAKISGLTEAVIKRIIDKLK